MYFLDYHNHSNFSFDGNYSLEESLISAINKGIKEIAFTEHYDYREKQVIIPLLDFEEYKKEISRLREKYKDRIKLIFGLELGLNPNYKSFIEKNIKEFKFDFIIGSSHLIKEEDFAYKNFYSEKSKDEAFSSYFEEINNCIKSFDEFDVYGHFDLIRRYSPYEDKSFPYKKYSDIIEDALKNLIHKGKGLEINCSGFRYGLDILHPHKEILKAYKNLGGEIITIGSDSHKPEDVASNLKKAYELLKSLDFKYFTSFENRIAKFINLDNFIIKE